MARNDPSWLYSRERPTTSVRELEEVLDRRETNRWAGPAPPPPIAAGIHDPNGGPDVRTEFEPVGGRWPHGAIVGWLRSAAERLSPARLG